MAEAACGPAQLVWHLGRAYLGCGRATPRRRCPKARRLEPKLPAHLALSYVGRPERASPSEGYAIAHEAQEEKIVQAALAPKPDSPRPQGSG